MLQMTIGRKIWGACALMAAVTAGLGVTAMINVHRIQGAAQGVTDDALPGAYLAGRLNTGAKAILIRINLHMQSNSPEKQAQYQAYLVDRVKKWREEAKGYAALPDNDQERALLRDATADFERLLEGWEKILPLSSAHRHEEAFAVYEREVMAVAEHLDATMKSLVAINKQLGDEASAKAAAAASASQTWTMAVLIAALFTGGGVVFLIVRGVNGTLRRAVKALAESSRQVAASSAQIAQNGQALAEGASEQAASLEETSASSVELNAMAGKSAENSVSAAELVGQSQTGFVAANRSLGEMVEAMDQINDSSGRISKIIRVIDEIAFQTNILALNAAVEAARAGEAGMGFAVVADEVRNLAQRSAQAAKDTSVLIEESIARSEGGKGKVEEAARSIRAITGSAEQVHRLIDEVSKNSREQARGIQHISQAINQMDQVTQRTAANAEESAAAAQSLNAQSVTLNEIVEELYSLIEHNDGDMTKRLGLSDKVEAQITQGDRIQAAIGAHGLWKTRLRDAILTGASDVTVEKARSDRHCAFGNWLHGPDIDPEIKRSRAYENCVELHRRFHLAAADALSLALSGKKLEARQALEPNSQFSRISTELTRALTECQANHSCRR